MAVDNPSTASLPSRKKQKPSKTDLKMSLVAKRILMLQDDDDIRNVAAEVPSQHKREITQQKTKTIVKDLFCDDDGQIKSSSVEQKICARTKPVFDITDDESSEEMKPISSSNRRKHGSYKRMRVISDDESSDDREIVVPPETRKKISNRRDSSHDLSDNIDSSAMNRAKEVQANLSAKYPSFIKLMSRSHVIQGFWLGLPMKFRNAHLPKCDCTIVLVDENGKECKTKFLAQKSGLSGGWREFAITHDLHEGDAVVFHLINPTTFKLYIVRADKLGEVDGVLGLLNLDASQRQWISEPEDHTEEIVKTDSSSDIELGPEVVDGIRFSDALITFEGIKTFENFNIVVDGLVMDSKFTDNIKKKYYELCCSQGTFLHECLLKGLNCSLVVGIISEVVNIADAIRACRGSTFSYDDLRIWEKTLKGFELLGMNVFFLCERLNLLLGIAKESDLIDEARLEEARIEQARTGEKMRALESKFVELKKMIEMINLEMEVEMQASTQKRERIKEIANAAW